MNESYRKAIRIWSVLKAKGRLTSALNVDSSEILSTDKLHELIYLEYEKFIKQEKMAKEIEEELKRRNDEDESKYNDNEKQLLNLLGDIAFYNDKGWQWSNHDFEEKSKVQNKYGKDLQDLLTRFDSDNLTVQAMYLFNASNVTCDCLGEFQATAKVLLSTNGFYISRENA